MRLGVFNVDKMLRGLTAKQFAEWTAYAQLEALDDDARADWRTASIAKHLADNFDWLAEVLCASKGIKEAKRPRRKKYELADYKLKWEMGPKKPKRKQTVEEQWSIIEMIMHANSVPHRD